MLAASKFPIQMQTAFEGSNGGGIARARENNVCTDIGFLVTGNLPSSVLGTGAAIPRTPISLQSRFSKSETLSRHLNPKYRLLNRTTVNWTKFEINCRQIKSSFEHFAAKASHCRRPFIGQGYLSRHTDFTGRKLPFTSHLLY